MSGVAINLRKLSHRHPSPPSLLSALFVPPNSRSLLFSSLLYLYPPALVLISPLILSMLGYLSRLPSQLTPSHLLAILIHKLFSDSPFPESPFFTDP